MEKVRRLIISSFATVIGFSLIIMNAGAQQQAKPWEVPAEYKTMKNPIAKDEASIKAGGVLYMKNCASCHGKTGLGDGVKARALKDFPGDLTGSFYQDQTDGEHFYKTKFGRNEMPKYEGKMTDDDIWNMVNYMRTLKKETP